MLVNEGRLQPPDQNEIQCFTASECLDDRVCFQHPRVYNRLTPCRSQGPPLRLPLPVPRGGHVCIGIWDIPEIVTTEACEQIDVLRSHQGLITHDGDRQGQSRELLDADAQLPGVALFPCKAWSMAWTRTETLNPQLCSQGCARLQRGWLRPSPARPHQGNEASQPRFCDGF